MPAFHFAEAETLMNHSTQAMLCRIGIEPPIGAVPAEASA
jgi:hypothetical protein